jgi:hypothetical protein
MRLRKKMDLLFLISLKIAVLAEIVSCGGHNPHDGYTGDIVSRDNFYI